MTLWSLGSINADHVCALPHQPRAGDTLAAWPLSTDLGANMPVAAARAGTAMSHVGAHRFEDDGEGRAGERRPAAPAEW